MSSITDASSDSAPRNQMRPCCLCHRLQRRCRLECPVAEYFPANESSRFRYVHRVFGAQNVARMIEELPLEHRNAAASTLIYDAALRIRDPIRGAAGVISGLQRQLKDLRAENESLRNQIAALTAEAAATRVNVNQTEGEASEPTEAPPGEPSSSEANKRLRVAPPEEV